MDKLKIELPAIDPKNSKLATTEILYAFRDVLVFERRTFEIISEGGIITINIKDSDGKIAYSIWGKEPLTMLRKMINRLYFRQDF